MCFVMRRLGVSDVHTGRVFYVLFNIFYVSSIVVLIYDLLA